MPKYTAATLQAWFDTLPNPDKEERDLTWFFAYREAEDWGDYSTKELAEILQNGIPALTVEDSLEEFYCSGLEDFQDEGGENFDENEAISTLNERLENEIREFYLN